MKQLILLLLFIPLVSFGQTVVGDFKIDNGEHNTYYESGKLKSTANYVDGLAQGEWKSFYYSGKLKSTANYVDGLAQGELKYYYKSGELEVTGNYVDGVKQ
jgi:antitoxin component YwqK of YwqJK toxin-antitoxin module